MLRTPCDATANGTDAPDDGTLLSIGSVLNVLRVEFPDVTVSKIRFLETEGLVRPGRTPSGYRKFSPQDVERLSRVLRMQRDHYLPLKVIREQLDTDTDVVAGPEEPGAVPDPEQGEERGPGLGRNELMAAAEVGEDELAEWESYGLLRQRPGGGYDMDALSVAPLVRSLGLHGLGARHLRVLKGSAEREADMVSQLVAPLLRHPDAQTRADAAAQAVEIARCTVELHSVLVRRALAVPAD